MNGSQRVLKFVAIAAAAAFLAFAVAQQPVPTAEASFADTDGDGALDIGEEIAGSDPNDHDSFPETTWTLFLFGNPVCFDGLDNDLDGLTDEDDPGCTDSDGDIFSDPEEEFLGSDPLDVASIPEDSRIDTLHDFVGFGIFVCGDLVDNDLDGLTDGDDPGCATLGGDGDDFDDATEKRWGSDPGDPNSVPEHENPNPGSCSDGVDNDLDGLADAADPACGSPDNDDRADAIVIGSLPFSHGPVVMKNATSERNEPRPSCLFGSQQGTVWYRYAALEDGVLIADTDGSDFDTSIAVWRENGPGLDEVACQAGFSFPPMTRTAFRVEAGESYLFQIDGFPFGSPLPSLTFNLEAGVPPANDDFENATPIGGLPFTDSVDTSAATTEFGEPRPNCSGDPISTVWYSFTPSDDALLIADTAGSDFVSVVGIWTDSIFGLTNVACAIDFPFDGAATLRLALDAEAGETYYFQIGRYPFFGFSELGDGFALAFGLSVGVSPANDDFADAASISTLPFTATADTLTATVEAGEPNPTCLPYNEIGATTWYRFTPASDILVVADTEESELFNTAVGVYQGSSLADLTQVSCGGPVYPYTEFAFQATGGETYFIQTGVISGGCCFILEAQEGESEEAGDAPTTSGFRGPGTGGQLVLNLDLLDVPSCPADQFTVADPVGDTLEAGFFNPEGGPSHDLISVRGGADLETFCLTLAFAGPIEPPGRAAELEVQVTVDFDTDANRQTGFIPTIDFSCRTSARLGVDAEISMVGDRGILVPIFQFFAVPRPIPIGPIIDGILPSPPPPPGEELFAIALFAENSLTLVIPADAIGGDDQFNFALFVRNTSFRATDCAPNGGFIQSPAPATAGDVSCDGQVNSLDATMIMQFFAGLTFGLPCQHVGDLNGNGSVGPLDALLILQYDAGLLDALPPVPHTALSAAIQATAEMLDVPKGFIQLVGKEAQDWPNSCLGLAEPGGGCLGVITPGFRITLETDEHIVVWRTNSDGSVVRLEELR